MAMTPEYMDYLDDQIGIAPANSQEELQAAQVIAEVMRQHDLDPHMDEFEASAGYGVVPSVMLLVAFAGLLIAGIGDNGLTLIGLVLVAAVVALFVLRSVGNDVMSQIGGKARSQNVVAVHHATGPLVEKGNRPIVIVAHYDSPHESFLYSSPLSSALTTLYKVSPVLMLVVAVSTLFQVMGFVPRTTRLVIWVIGLVAAVPLVILGIGGIAEALQPCTIGSNDNKSSVAAMLGVLENVRPTGIAPVSTRSRLERANKTKQEAEAQQAAKEEAAEEQAATPQMAAEQMPVSVPATVTRRVPERVVGVRHGEETIREFGILPQDCQIEYVQNYVEVEVPRPAPVAAAAPASAPAMGEPSATVVAPRPVAAGELEPSDDEVPAEEKPISSFGSTVKSWGAKAKAFWHHSVPKEDEKEELLEEVEADQPEQESYPTTRVVPRQPATPAPAEPSYAPVEDDMPAQSPAPAEPVAEDPATAPGSTAPRPATRVPLQEAEPQPAEPPVAEEAQQFEDAPHPDDVPHPDEAPEDDVEQGGTMPMAPVDLYQFPTPEPADTTTSPLRFVEDDDEVDSADSADSTVAEESAPKQPQHRVPQVPEIGPEEPQQNDNLGRRATLYDLPDPTQATIDPFAPEPDLSDRGNRPSVMERLRGGSSHRDERKPRAQREDVEAAQDDAEDEQPFASISEDGDYLFPEDVERGKKGAKKSRFSFGRKKKDDGGSWKGGAASRGGLRGDDDEPTGQELAEAVLHMGDDELVAHDIWFVALGASSLGNAGMKSFLAKYRSAIRGAFLVNLDCVGTGELTLLTREGLDNTRRADRRLVRLLTSTAADLHMDLRQGSHDWADTDATPAMRASVRAVTIMGLGENGLPALSHTALDTPESVPTDQANEVAELVTEIIRRS